MQEQEIKNLMGELNKVKERLSQEIMKNAELEEEKADLIIAATSACNKYDKLEKKLAEHVSILKQQKNLTIATKEILNKAESEIDKLNKELQALQKLIDEAGDELPEKSETCVIYNKNVNSRIEITNEVVDHCIPVVAKLKQENESLKTECNRRAECWRNADVLLLELKQENEELKETIEENEELRGNSCG